MLNNSKPKLQLKTFKKFAYTYVLTQQTKIAA